MPPKVFLVTALSVTTIVVLDSVLSSVTCWATLVCVVIDGRLNVVPDPVGIARAPIAVMTGRKYEIFV